MPRHRLTFPAVAVLAIASLALGVVAALADGRDNGKRSGAVVHAPSPPAALPALPVPVTRALHPAMPAVSCLADEKPPAAAPVPQNLLDAFGVLRRERADADALPASALKALRQHGLEPFDPAAARLLRQTGDGGRAWVVPVRDVSENVGLISELACVSQRLSRQRQALAQTMRERRRQRARPGTRSRAARPWRVMPPTTTPAPPRVPAPSATAPPPAPVPDDTNKPTPHPGLAVVALDGAPGGAGGRLEDLVRGREDVATDPCGGPNRDMLSVSGIVPDGVSAAFLTSPDGTAVRADVKDNAYAFVVPRAKRPEQRYVIWTGGDGTPHVQPVGVPYYPSRARCPAAAAHQPPTVSPEASGLCDRFSARLLPAIVAPVPRPSARAPRAPLPARQRCCTGRHAWSPRRRHGRPRCPRVSGSSRKHDAHPSATGSLQRSGGVAERLNAPVLKTGDGASRSRVRIPPPPSGDRGHQRVAKSSSSSTSCGQSERTLR